MALNDHEIESLFGHHKATIEGPEATLPKHKELREKFKELARYLNDVLPDGRQKSICFTELENASMRSHKSVAELAPLNGD